MSMNLRQLRSLVAIAPLGNFTRAAQSLHISQPALTVQMHPLEEALGARLLDRNTRTVKLTTLGSQIVPIIERALGDIDTAIAGTRLTAESIGTVSIAGLPSLCSNLIPTAIARFNAQHPGIAVRVHEIGVQRLAACVLEEEVELAIGRLSDHRVPVAVRCARAARRGAACSRRASPARSRGEFHLHGDRHGARGPRRHGRFIDGARARGNDRSAGAGDQASRFRPRDVGHPQEGQDDLAGGRAVREDRRCGARFARDR